MNKVMNGYTIIATTHIARHGAYLIMGMRRNTSGGFTYVTAWCNNIDLDTEWYWGNYGGTHFPDTIVGATADFVSRQEG